MSDTAETLSLHQSVKVESERYQNATKDEEQTLSSPVNDAATTTVPGKKHYSFYLSILMLVLGCVTVSWDATALSLALPVIANQLQGTTFQSFWASIAFILGMAVSQPVYASVSDVIGRRPPLHFSILLFGVGSIVFATAKDMKVVVAGRLIKGVGAGGLDVLLTIILCDITTLKERPRYMGALSLGTAVGGVSGPILGGVIAEYVNWRWIGWINVIVAVITLGLEYFFLNLKPIEGNIRTKLLRLDWSGFFLFSVASAAVALPLSWADALYTWASWQTLVPLIIGFLLLIPFAFVERKAVEPVIPYRIFDNVSTIVSAIMAFIYGMIVNPVILYVPLFFQAVFLEAPLQAAISTLPLLCIYVAFNFIATVAVEMGRRYRVPLWAGWIISTTFLGLLYMVGGDSTRAEAFSFQALLGAGLGIVLTTTIVSMLASVKRVDDDGLAAGMWAISRFLGSLFGLAVCSAVFNNVFNQSIAPLGVLPEQLRTLEGASQAVSLIPKLRDLNLSDEVMRGVLAAYQKSFQTIWVVLAGFSALSTLASLLIKEHTLEKEDVGRQGFQPPS